RRPRRRPGAVAPTCSVGPPTGVGLALGFPAPPTGPVAVVVPPGLGAGGAAVAVTPMVVESVAPCPSSTVSRTVRAPAVKVWDGLAAVEWAEPSPKSQS